MELKVQNLQLLHYCVQEADDKCGKLRGLGSTASTSLCLRVGCDELNGIGCREDLIGFAVGNLNPKLLLESHDHLHSVQAVQSKIICEMGGGRDLRKSAQDSGTGSTAFTMMRMGSLRPESVRLLHQPVTLPPQWRISSTVFSTESSAKPNSTTIDLWDARRMPTQNPSRGWQNSKQHVNCSIPKCRSSKLCKLFQAHHSQNMTRRRANSNICRKPALTTSQTSNLTAYVALYTQSDESPDDTQYLGWKLQQTFFSIMAQNLITTPSSNDEQLTQQKLKQFAPELRCQCMHDLS